MSAEISHNDPSARKILIVDDEEVVLSTLRELLQMEGYHVTAVNHPTKALELLQRDHFSVVLSDQEMPDMTGLVLLGKVKELFPTTTRLLITGRLGMSEITDAANSGLVYRFISKPWLHSELVLTLRNAVERYELLTEKAALHARNVALNLKISQMANAAPAADSGGEAGMVAGEGGEQTYGGGGETQEGGAEVAPEGVDLAVQAFVKMLYTFHPNLGNTAMRSVALCQTLGETLELNSKDLKDLLWAAALFDIGLVQINRDIVRRWIRGPEKCTDEEMVEIKRHPAKAEEMLQFCPIFKDAGEIIRMHHENWDGSGYPDGMKGEMINYLSRLLAVVIYFCNKHSASVQVMVDIESQAEKMFDPEAIQAVAKAVPLTTMPRGEREILLIELKAGMVLAKDILNANNFLLLPKGRELSDVHINKIFSINRVSPLEPYVLVYC